MKISLPFAIAIIIYLVVGVAAQEKIIAETVFEGMAQPAVVNLPLPEYPLNVLTAHLGGKISVAVTVNKKGNVTSADDADGSYPVCKSATNPSALALRKSATAAAKKAKFTPGFLSQDSVIVYGRINYIFSPPTRTSVAGELISPKGSAPDIPKPVKNPGTFPGDKIPGIASTEQSETVGSDSAQPKLNSVVNGKALILPKPNFPNAAKLAGAHGSVTVTAIIEPDGKVYSAEAISGDPLLRQSAEIAACQAVFSPTLLSGQPVRVSGDITYHFVR